MSATDHTRFEACHAAGAMLVEHCDVPEGMSLSQWRADCAAERAEREVARSAYGRLRTALRRR